MQDAATDDGDRRRGGAMGIEGCKVILRAYERALADGAPIVGIWHSGGARLAEGVASLHAVGEVFAIMTRASGKIPQISIVIGAAAVLVPIGVVGAGLLGAALAGRLQRDLASRVVDVALGLLLLGYGLPWR